MIRVVWYKHDQDCGINFSPPTFCQKRYPPSRSEIRAYVVKPSPGDDGRGLSWLEARATAQRNGGMLLSAEEASGFFACLTNVEEEDGLKTTLTKKLPTPQWIAAETGITQALSKDPLRRGDWIKQVCHALGGGGFGVVLFHH